MNAKRRTQIKKLEAKLEAIRDEFSQILEDEQNYEENIPESMQDGEKAEASRFAIDQLEQADSPIDELIEIIQEASA